jgi:GTP pyrophosphokinase
VKKLAEECLNVYAPLADRLGIQQIKDELEDLSLKYLNHDAFQQIKEIVASKKSEREAFLAEIKAILLAEAQKSSLSVEIYARAKHFYSIYQKMKRRGKSRDELFDLQAVRVLCRNTEQCYTALGLCHRLWKPVDGRFKDYIAMPKSNGYCSLHTTVVARGRPFEIQIRTFEMHETAEFGVASHWLYKKGSTAERPRVGDLPLINKLKEWRVFPEADDAALDFLAEIKRELLGDAIFVWTPLGKVVELPRGATPVDFAYAVHSGIGDHCALAKANGKATPLSAPLKNTQVVEILTQVNAHPNRNWLDFVKTAKARSKIRAWLARNEDTSGHQKEGGEKTPHIGTQPSAPKLGTVKKRRVDKAEPAISVSVAGEKNILVRFAKCCSPAPHSAITGFISHSRGIIVHRADCLSLARIADFEERRIDVEWVE